jgi:hypothetical protein
MVIDTLGSRQPIAYYIARYKSCQSAFGKNFESIGALGLQCIAVKQMYAEGVRTLGASTDAGDSTDTCHRARSQRAVSVFSASSFAEHSKS